MAPSNKKKKTVPAGCPRGTSAKGRGGIQKQKSSTRQAASDDAGQGRTSKRYGTSGPRSQTVKRSLTLEPAAVCPSQGGLSQSEEAVQAIEYPSEELSEVQSKHSKQTVKKVKRKYTRRERSLEDTPRTKKRRDQSQQEAADRRKQEQLERERRATEMVKEMNSKFGAELRPRSKETLLALDSDQILSPEYV
mmetsp:Transcript_31519/g.49353  ORF Transcript_31519/g.49353 Transcript_31519/m.49353 type:complete len:192 (+) Transcript_31519:272-847(+)